MSKQVYLQINTDSIITDCVEYQVSGYVPATLNLPLPVGLIGGWYKFENGTVVEHTELKPESTDDRLAALNENQLIIMEALTDIFTSLPTT